jgi:K+-transporting ATPase ATPase A chain
VLPFHPAGFHPLTLDAAFNTAVSMATNTGWQPYAGERSLTHLVQMAGITVQGFASAGSGMAVAAALARGFAAHRSGGIGNFWVSLVRNNLYILIPGAVIFALILAGLGVPQTLLRQVDASTVEGARQTILLGPVASQKAITLLGTEGVGFFRTNSAHPFENPSPVSNLLEAAALCVLAFGCVSAFGRVIRAPSEARALAIVMFVLLAAAASIIYVAETGPTPALAMVHANGPNMEGKEVRFGAPSSSVFVAMTTGSTAGATSSTHESLTPLGGGVAMFLILIGGILPGGAGSGLLGIIVLTLLAVFISGQMVGRTPEYLGKRIETREVKLAVLATLLLSISTLGFTALASVTPQALRAVSVAGPHGLSEMLYAYASSTANNGSSFEGIKDNTVYWNLTTAAAMLIGRFGLAIPVLAIAGRFAAKPKLPPSSGTFPTDGPLFMALLCGVILITAGLQYFPALALGPIVEQLQMNAALRR